MSGPKHPQGLKISDPHHLAATFYLRGLLNTSISRSTPNIPGPLEDFQITSIFHITLNNIPYPKGSLQLWASSISAVVYVLHREKPSWVVHSICGPWPRNSNVVTVELGTFRHSSTLPAISMDFQKIKNKAIDIISQIGQPWPARGGAIRHRPAPRHRPPNPSSTVSSRYSNLVNQASPSQIINCITYYPSIPDLETEALCNLPPERHDQTKWSSAKNI